MTTEEVFNYETYLSKLNPGDIVKTNNCSHKKECHCSKTVVTSISEMFNEECIVVKEGCAIRYFSRQNGRELGNRKGIYKDGGLSPYTKEDEQKELLAKAEKEAADLKYQLAQSLSRLLAGDTAFVYELNRKLEAAKMAQLIDLLSPYDL